MGNLGSQGGRPLSSQDIPDRVVPRFWNRVETTDGCWVWTGTRAGPNSYGIMFWQEDGQRKPVLAHRLGVVLQGRDLARGEIASNRCGNKACVRLHPDHVVVSGSQQESCRGSRLHGRRWSERRELVNAVRAAAASATNRELADQFGLHLDHVRDIVAGKLWRDPGWEPPKQRPKPKWGERHASSKMTEETVVEARRLHAAGETNAALSRRYAVAASTMAEALHGQTWSFLPDSCHRHIRAPRGAS